VSLDLSYSLPAVSSIKDHQQGIHLDENHNPSINNSRTPLDDPLPPIHIVNITSNSLNGSFVENSTIILETQLKPNDNITLFLITNKTLTDTATLPLSKWRKFKAHFYRQNLKNTTKLILRKSRDKIFNKSPLAVAGAVTSLSSLLLGTLVGGPYGLILAGATSPIIFSSVHKIADQGAHKVAKTFGLKMDHNHDHESHDDHHHHSHEGDGKAMSFSSLAHVNSASSSTPPPLAQPGGCCPGCGNNAAFNLFQPLNVAKSSISSSNSLPHGHSHSHGANGPAHSPHKHTHKHSINHAHSNSRSRSESPVSGHDHHNHHCGGGHCHGHENSHGHSHSHSTQSNQPKSSIFSWFKNRIF